MIYLNNCLPAVKVEADISTATFNFSDVNVYLNREGILSTGLIQNPQLQVVPTSKM